MTTNNRFHAYAEAGFLAHALPILPYNAVLSARSTVDASQRAKVPGAWDVNYGCWTGMQGWTTEQFTMDHVRRWNRYPVCNVGLRTGTILAVDGDVEWAVETFKATVLRVLGQAPARFRANSPRFLLPYRLKDEGYEEKPRKRMIKFASPDGKEHQFDLLAHGQQFVGEGVHTSGVPIQWEGGFDPIEMTFNGLTEITLSQWQSLGDELSTVIEANDCTIVSSSASGSSDNRVSVFSDAHRARDMEAFAAAIQKIDNTEIPYDDWLPLLHAIKAGCGGDHEFFVNVVMPWCLTYSSNTEEIVEAKWESISASALGAEYVFGVARTEWGFNGGDDHFGSGDDGDVTDAEPDNNNLPPHYSDQALAGRFVDTHVGDARYIVGEKAWFIRDAGGDWSKDESNVIGNMVNGFAREEATFASRYINTADKGDAKRVASANCQTSILKLAQCDPRVVIKRVVFAPGQTLGADELNSWRGFAVEPKPGSWALFKEHMLENLCDGHRDQFEYLVKWMAHGVQHLDTLPGKAIVLKGDEGVGKGCYARHYGRLFGEHFSPQADAEHSVGRFNNALRTTVLLYADEAFFAGDIKHEGKLKQIITEPEITYEQKYHDPIVAKNHLRVIIASNHEWVVPAGINARRFFVLNVADHHREDAVYFDAIEHEMMNGGAEAMLHELVHMDLSGFNVHASPMTEGLVDQKLHSLKSVEAFWYEALTGGKLGNSIWPTATTVIGRDRLYEIYLDYLKRQTQRYPATKQWFGRRLRKMVPSLNDYRPRNDGGSPVRMYQLPPLTICREEFEKFIKGPIEWDD